MQEDRIVEPRSESELHALAMDWRRALEFDDQWAPELVSEFEKRLPKIIPGFELVAIDEQVPGGALGFARYPRMFVHSHVREGALAYIGRDRMTLSHEFAHLVLHPDAPLPRMVTENRPAPIKDRKRSAEWQARKFAAFFLMPEYIVREFMTFQDLAEGCKVSLEAAELRFIEVGHVRRDLSPSIKAWLDDMKRKYRPDLL